MAHHKYVAKKTELERTWDKTILHAVLSSRKPVAHTQCRVYSDTTCDITPIIHLKCTRLPPANLQTRFFTVLSFLPNRRAKGVGLGTRLSSYSLFPSPPPPPVVGHLWDRLASFKKLGRSLGTRLGYVETGWGKSGYFLECLQGNNSEDLYLSDYQMQFTTNSECSPLHLH